ncbi:MAG TPA: type IV pilin protein, partial [Vicinamibacterales bacterium]
MPGTFRPKKVWEMAHVPAGPPFTHLQHMFTDPFNLAAIVLSLVSVSMLQHRKAASPKRAARFVRPRGFTLIELIIVIAIIALLVALALPSYRDHMRKSRRAEAQAYLMAIAGRQQQFLVDSRGYAPTLATINIP